MIKKFFAKHKSKRGINFAIVVLLFIVISSFFYTTNLLQVSSRRQVYHSSKSEWSFLIAYSAMCNVLAKLQSDGWANRVFANNFYRERNDNFLGGGYELFVEDTPNQDYLMDIYVRASIGSLSKCYFWRVRYYDDLLDVSNRFSLIFFKEIDQNNFPTRRGPTAFTQLIDDLLRERKNNQKKSDEIAKQIRETNRLSDILQNLHARPLSNFEPTLLAQLANTNTNSILPNTPRLPSENIFSFSPQTSVELPTSSGFGGRTTFSNPSQNNNQIQMPEIEYSNYVDRQRLYDISNEIVRNTRETLQEIIEGVNIVNAGNSGGDWNNPAAQQAFRNAVEAYNNAQSAMNDLYSITRQMMSECSSSEVAAELERILTSTIVSACSDLTNALSQYYSHHNIGAATVGSINSIPELTNAINIWRQELQNFNNLAEGIVSHFDELANFNLSPEIQNAISSMQQQIQEARNKILNTISLAEAKLRELEEQERERERQSSENRDPADESNR